MTIFKVIGIGMIVLGAASGAAIFLTPFGLNVSGSMFTLWLFFALCFVGGFILYALGSRQASASEVLKTAGGILLILGLLSAVSIFLAKVGIAHSEDSGSLWALFLICTPAGMAAVLAAEHLHGKKIGNLLPGPFSGGSPRPPGVP
jgi:peptidoglycan/LPS O-acetylase OafA/YrhL